MRFIPMLGLALLGSVAGRLPLATVCPLALAAEAVTPATVDAVGRPLAPEIATILRAVAAADRRLPQLAPDEAKAERTPQQAAKTLDRYQKAAADGFVSAQYNLAEALVDRRGIAPDVDRAIALLRQIAERGYQPAQMRLAEENLRGEGKGTSRAEAYAWYNVAYHDGNGAAERALSLLGPLLTPAERETADRLSRSIDATVTLGRQHRPLPSQQKTLDAALMAALDSDDRVKVDGLLAQGADPDAIDKDGRSAIINAAWRDRGRVVALLLERGADTDRRDDEGHTALAWAAINGYPDIALSLLAAGSMTGIPDKDGLTPLMRAAWDGHPDVVRALLDNGARTDLADASGKTALDRALSQDDKTIAAMLRRAAGTH
ncbi:MAG TPA: ankyrin repeat domain-containing protein [Candidatus Sulfotelmatobacter sp.]|nr:ankyrin repeat domain-containing protein [Candidatus Sulfotelmatobacter sp.]